MYKYKEELREKLGEYLYLFYGVDTSKKFSCLSGTHLDRIPSMKYYSDSNICYCFSCNATMDLFSIIGKEYGLADFRAQYEKALSLFGYPTQLDTPPRQTRDYSLYKERVKDLTEKKKREDYLKYLFILSQYLGEVDRVHEVYWTVTPEGYLKPFPTIEERVLYDVSQGIWEKYSLKELMRTDREKREQTDKSQHKWGYTTP